MKVFFTASYHGKAKFQKNYNIIIDSLKSHKIIVLSFESKKTINNKNLHKEIVHFIKKADFVLIECSVNSFKLGHEATLALLHNKPVFCISQEGELTEYIKLPMFHSFTYKTVRNIPFLIDSIVKLYTNRYKTERINLLLNSSQKAFLVDKAQQENKSVSSLIREIIDLSRH